MVHENGVFLYQAKDLANEIRKMGGTEVLGLIFVTVLMNQPLFAVPVWGAWSYAWGRVKIP